MQGNLTYIPEKNHVPREYSVAAMLLFMVLISLVPVLTLLHFYISTFRSMCAVPNMTVFCSSLTSCFPGMLLMFIIIIIIIIISRLRADKSLCQYGHTVSTTVHCLMSFDLNRLSCVRC